MNDCRLYDFHSFSIIPTLGQLIASDRASYQYLVESIARFPPQPAFAQMIAEAGFYLPGTKGGREAREGREGAWEDLTNGVASVHIGVKV